MKAAKSLPDVLSAPHFTVWPASLQVSRNNQRATLLDTSPKPLSELLCRGWRCSLNPEFNCLYVDLLPGQRRSMHYWVKRFGMLGHEHCLLARLPRTQVLLYRPVCTYSGEDSLCFHYLNRVPSLVHLEC